MKKFLKFMLALVIIVGACAAYFFLANGKMMWHVVKTDKSGLAGDITNAVSKVHDYGNFNFTYSSKDETKDQDGKVVESREVNSAIKIKFDGEITYLTATKVLTDKDGNKTTTKYYAERSSDDVTTIFVDDGENKTQEVVGWNEAIARVMDEADVSHSIVSKVVNEIDYKFSDEEMDHFKKATISFSFSPFYVGSKIVLNSKTASISSQSEYDIDLRGNLRKNVLTNTWSVGELIFTSSETLVINKPGKGVDITKLTDEVKQEYLS